MNKRVLFVAGIAACLALGARSAAAQGVNADSLYKKHCKTCHGATGTPTARMTGMYPDLKALDATTLKGVSADSVMAWVKKGKGKDMKPFGEKMSADEIAAVAQYVLKTFGGGK
jgi:mono/diheme cytochrome c family protein